MIKVLSAASEVFPLIKTGGLADVTGALPAALAPHDVAMRCLIPGYSGVLRQLEKAAHLWQEAEYFGGPATLLEARVAGLDLIVLDAPHLYARAGNIYLAPDGADWPDNPLRFAALAYAAALIGTGALPGYQPDILHLHDWQTALAPAYLHYGGSRQPATILTVHNLAFQGIAPATWLGALRLPVTAFALEGVEFFGKISMLKAGLMFADRITTVSPTYADEIRTPAYGMGLDGVLRARGGAVCGITNGIDTDVWNPETDIALPVPYSAARPSGKAAAKAALQARLGLTVAPDAPLFGVVSRFSYQKGLDLLLACLDSLTGSGAQLALLGAGEAALENGFSVAAAANPGTIAVAIGYDESLAHLIQAGADAILVPSRFEPCGLTQLCALRYGSIPVVSRVGGLADTVIDANGAALQAGVATGLQFSPVTAESLRTALLRAITLLRGKHWSTMMKNALRADVGWETPAQAYADLYREISAAERVQPAKSNGVQ